MDTKKILIAEDEKTLADAIDKQLSTKGFETSLVFNGKDALDLLKTQSYDLAIIDIIMPGIDGWQVLKYLSEHNIHAIVISNLKGDETENRAKEMGADAYFQKDSINLDDVVKKVDEILQNQI